jgi:hypothetical protein
MVLGVLIPDRGDRPEFLSNLFGMLSRQTIKPDHIDLVNFKPKGKGTDLTERVRIGFESLKSKGCDVVFIMENDDFYAPEYIETMLFLWELNDEPDIFGTDRTIYYHIEKREYKILGHSGRSSLMNTLLSTKANIKWPKDSEVFLDINLWRQLKGKAVRIDKTISIGIKHGVGLCGGAGHDRMEFDFKDPFLSYLRSKVDSDSFDFYRSLFPNSVPEPESRFKLGIVTACWKRPEIFELFANAMKKLSHPELEIHVIVAGSEGTRSKTMVKKHGFHYIEIPNDPLATKVNASTIMAGHLNCDYVLCLGSDDIISNELLEIYVDYMKEGIDYIGVLDWYFYDTVSRRFAYWGGYRDPRRLGHTCGAGRLISSNLMKKWNWQPWEVKHSHVLDNSMQDKLKTTPHSIRTFKLKDRGVLAFDIKSRQNMTKFELWDNTSFIRDKKIEETYKQLVCAE